MTSKKWLKSYYDGRLLNQFNLDSYDKFISDKLQEVVNEVKKVIPDILPPKVRDFEIRFGKANRT